MFVCFYDCIFERGIYMCARRKIFSSTLTKIYVLMIEKRRKFLLIKNAARCNVETCRSATFFSSHFLSDRGRSKKVCCGVCLIRFRLLSRREARGLRSGLRLCYTITANLQWTIKLTKELEKMFIKERNVSRMKTIFFDATSNFVFLFPQSTNLLSCDKFPTTLWY